MTTTALLLSASPLQIERHEFLDVEVHAADGDEVHTSLPLNIERSCSRHADDPLRWQAELTVRFGGEIEGKPSVYAGRLRVVGYFAVHASYPAEKSKQLIEVTGASILYGACREMLANLTGRGSQGVVSLPSISFVPPKQVDVAGKEKKKRESLRKSDKRMR